MKTALIAKKMKKRSARSGAFRIRRTGASAFFSMLFPLPHCLAVLKLGGPGQFSKKIIEFYHHLCLLAKMAMESTGSAVITFSPEEVAKLLGVSATTVRNWIAYLVDNGVLMPLDRKGGRGKKAQFLFQIKTQQQETVPPNPGTTTFRTPPPERTRSAHNPERKKKSQEETSPNPRPEGTDTPPKSSAAEDRAKKLKELPDDTPVEKVFNSIMEQFRRRCWQMGYSRQESDMLCNALGRKIKGKTLGQARTLATWFWKNARWVLERLREVAKKGVRAAYAMLGFLFGKVLGILRPRPKQKPKPRSPRWRWDLNDAKQRKAFVKLVEKIIEQGGGTCPRCGQVIRVEYWEQDAGLAFQDPGGCRCLYIAFDRDAREREQRDKLDHQVLQVPETERRPSGGQASLGEVLRDLIGVRSGGGVLPLPP